MGVWEGSRDVGWAWGCRGLGGFESGLEFRGLGFKGLGLRGFGFRGLGVEGLGFAGTAEFRGSGFRVRDHVSRCLLFPFRGLRFLIKLGRALGHFLFALIGLMRILFTNIFQRL